MTKKVASQDKKNDVLAIASPSQKDIPAFLEKVNAKIAELKGGRENKETTSGTSLPGFGRIKDVNKVEDLVKAHSMVVNKERVYQESADALDIDVKKYPFKLEGFTAKAWEDDIKARLSVVKNETELKKLEQVKKLLEENLSQEAKLANDLKKAQSILLDEI